MISSRKLGGKKKSRESLSERISLRVRRLSRRNSNYASDGGRLRKIWSNQNVGTHDGGARRISN